MTRPGARVAQPGAEPPGRTTVLSSLHLLLPPMRPTVSTALRLLPALLLAAPLAGALAPAATAQTVGARQRLVLRDGTVIVGTVVEVRDATVVIEGGGVRSEVPRERIVRVEDAGRFARVDPVGTRLFVTPTARTMPKSSLRLSTAYFFIPNVAYGVTGNLDISATASIPIDGNGIVSATAKFAPVQTSTMALAVGVQVSTIYGSEFSGGFGGTFYGVGTFGDATQAFTVGAYGVYGGSGNDDFTIGEGVGLVVGGEKQVSNSIKVMTENAFAIPLGDENDPIGITSAGVRFFSDRLAADVALPLFAYDGSTVRLVKIPIPLIGISYTIR